MILCIPQFDEIEFFKEINSLDIDDVNKIKRIETPFLLNSVFLYRVSIFIRNPNNLNRIFFFNVFYGFTDIRGNAGAQISLPRVFLCILCI